eukprot:m.493398 g.493398  ORF g.493398 m.493398 type:complete len:377 (+) comp57284_c0_seq10:932-2062(+)
MVRLLRACTHFSTPVTGPKNTTSSLSSSSAYSSTLSPRSSRVDGTDCSLLASGTEVTSAARVEFSTRSEIAVPESVRHQSREQPESLLMRRKPGLLRFELHRLMLALPPRARKASLVRPERRSASTSRMSSSMFFSATGKQHQHQQQQQQQTVSQVPEDHTHPFGWPGENPSFQDSANLDVTVSRTKTKMDGCFDLPAARTESSKTSRRASSQSLIGDTPTQTLSDPPVQPHTHTPFECRSSTQIQSSRPNSASHNRAVTLMPLQRQPSAFWNEMPLQSFPLAHQTALASGTSDGVRADPTLQAESGPEPFVDPAASVASSSGRPRTEILAHYDTPRSTRPSTDSTTPGLLSRTIDIMRFDDPPDADPLKRFLSLD